MYTNINLYSTKHGEIERFLTAFYNEKINLSDKLKYSINFENPIEMSDIIAAFIDNTDKYKINMWLCLDKGIYINVTQHNADKIIRYIYERFPY